ncbi:unnamed protein product, partial [Heterosigma akashiwo]
TETAYRIHLGSLRFFCKLTGNYEDLLILEPNAPENCPSVKASTVEMLMRYKWGLKGSPLKVSPTGEALQMDVFGGVILCVGGWHAPNNIVQYLPMISAVRRAKDQCTPYIKDCNGFKDKKIEITRKNNHRSVKSGKQPETALVGCPSHLYNPRFSRSGNPAYNIDVTGTANDLKKTLAELHTVCGCAQVLPQYVKTIRDHLIAENRIVGLQFVVMMLIAIALFLRHEEFSRLDYEDVMFDLSDIDFLSGIPSLAFEMQGKGDVHPVILTLNSNNSVPELCCLRHLQVY